MVTLRRATAEDVPEMARVWREGWADGHLGHVPEELVAARTPASFDAWARARFPDAVVGEADGVLLGFVMVRGDEVDQVYVDRAARGTGAAGLLLAEAARLVEAAGHDRAWLAVASGNARARRFYEREGWVDEGRFDYEVTVDGPTIAIDCHRMARYLRTAQ